MTDTDYGDGDLFGETMAFIMQEKHEIDIQKVE